MFVPELVTLLAGLVVLAMGVARLAGAIELVPHPVVTGLLRDVPAGDDRSHPPALPYAHV